MNAVWRWPIERISGAIESRGRPPGFRRLAVVSVVQVVGGVWLLVAALLALVGGPGLNFAFMGFTVLDGPDPLVINGITLEPMGTLAVLIPIAALSLLGANQVRLNRTPVLTMAVAVAWFLVGVLFLLGGSDRVILYSTSFLVLVISGALDGRKGRRIAATGVCAPTVS